jgi:hypothetical protein
MAEIFMKGRSKLPQQVPKSVSSNLFRLGCRNGYSEAPKPKELHSKAVYSLQVSIFSPRQYIQHLVVFWRKSWWVGVIITIYLFNKWCC